MTYTCFNFAFILFYFKSHLFYTCCIYTILTIFGYIHVIPGSNPRPRIHHHPLITREEPWKFAARFSTTHVTQSEYARIVYPLIGDTNGQSYFRTSHSASRNVWPVELAFALIEDKHTIRQIYVKNFVVI